MCTKLTIQHQVMKETLQKLFLCSELKASHHFTLQQMQECEGTGHRPAVHLDSSCHWPSTPDTSDLHPQVPLTLTRDKRN